MRAIYFERIQYILYMFNSEILLTYAYSLLGIVFVLNSKSKNIYIVHLIHSMYIQYSLYSLELKTYQVCNHINLIL